jgi:S-DNA-T family DNA segregation ATPase FtsK/SpoIIIE
LATAERTLDEEDAPRPRARGRGKASPPAEAEPERATRNARPADRAPAAAPEEGRRHEVLGLFALAATILSGLALFSYDAREADNTIGFVGQSIANVLGTAFGVAAWFVPLELALLTGRLFTRSRSPLGLARVASTLVVVLIGCAMVHLAMPDQEVMGGHMPGGLFGEVLGEVMRSLFGLVGAFVVGLTVLLVTVVLRTSVSVVGVSKQVAGVAKKGGAKAAEGIGQVASALREARELELREREEERLRNQPKIVVGASSAGAVPAAAPSAAAEEAAPRRKKKKPEPVAEVDDEEAAIVAAIAKAAAEEAGEEPEARDADADAIDEDAEDDVEALEAEAKPIAPAGVVKLEAEADAKGSGARPKPKAGPTIVAPKASEPVPAPVTTAPSPAPAHASSAAQHAEFVLPPPSLLDAPPSQALQIDEKALRDNAERLVEKLGAYGVRGRIDEIHPGPVVTMYELEPESGTKLSKIASLADDLAMALAAQKVRIVAPIPGKARVGFELPNKHRQTVSLREILEDPRWGESKAALPVAFGKDIAGQPVYGDLAKMPHLLVAGATGAGKSVGLNVMLASLLMKRTPDEVRLLMIDPKVVELRVFDGIPHMLLPVVTDMKKASLALRWAVDEMERRYQLFADAGARNITTYNERVDKVLKGELSVEKLHPKKHGKQVAQGPEGEEVLVDPVDGERADEIPMPTRLPYVVVVVDEFADLMMVAAKDVEAAIARLAQKARAAGIHVILATQRPSVDVITGMIKANFPARIAFKVSQREDSKTILGRIGAEHLLGAGDMLMIPPGASDLKRVHSAYISEDEVQAVCDHLREQGKPVYDERIIAPREDEEGGEVGADAGGEGGGSGDALYDKAVAAVATAGYCSISHLQRQLGVGYNKAAKLVERMEKEGVVGPASGKAGGRREVLVSAA